MIENFFAPQNLPFLIAFGLLGLIFVLELLSLATGAGIFSFLDGLLPDIGLDADADLDVSAAAEGTTFFQGILAALNLGKVPAVFSLIAFLFLFSCIGFNVQLVLAETGVGRLHPLLAAPAVFFVTLPFLRWANAILAKLLPKTETSIISEEQLIGLVGFVTVGTMTHNKQAEVRVKDLLERLHYVQAVSDSPESTFKQGDAVLLAGRRGYLFTVIPVTNPNLEERTTAQ